MNQGKPNCIFLIADQLRYDVLGKGFTPNIDALMGDSIRFTNAYCASPLCVPARGALFTGTYPGVNGSVINGWLPSEAVYSQVKSAFDNLYEMMERLGMECIHSGKQHLFTEGGRLQERPDTKTLWLTTEQTYREFLKENGKRAPGGPVFRTPVAEMMDGIHTRVSAYSNPHTGIYGEGARYYYDEYFTEEALKALENVGGDKPLFLSMMYLAPHPPFEIPEPWYSMIKPEEVDLPGNVSQWYAHQSPLQKYNVTGVIGNTCHEEDWRETWRVYMGLVALLDSCIGRITEELKRKDLYDNSVIVFGSDHGEMLGSHCLFQKMCMYEESVKTPLSIHLPGGENSGSTVETYVSHVDVLPTICELYGITTVHEMNGISLIPLIKGGKGSWERPVFIQYDGNGSRGNYQRCVIWNKYKLIVDIFKDETYYELYDLERDSQETVNLLFEEGEFKEVFFSLAAEMELMLRRHRSKMHDPVTFSEPDFKRFVEIYR